MRRSSVSALIHLIPAVGVVVALAAMPRPALLQAEENTPAGQVRLWDTMVKENDRSKLPKGLEDRDGWAYEWTSSKSWKNKANWKQIPYGTTAYTFSGNAVIETDAYYYFLHTNTTDGPFMFHKYPTGVLERAHYGAEQYGAALGARPGEKNDNLGNYHFNAVKEIIKNAPGEVVLKIDAGGFGADPVVDKNVVYYRFKGPNWVAISPANDYEYKESFHSATGRLAVVPANDVAGTDFVVDAKYDIDVKESDPQKGKRFLPPATANRFVLQLSAMKGADPAYHVLYMLAYVDPAAAHPSIDASKHRRSPTIEVFGALMKRGGANSAVCLAAFPYGDLWHQDEPGTAIAAGGTFKSPWSPTIPGKYRMTGLVQTPTGEKVYRTTEVSYGNCVFTSPVAGTLVHVVIYLSDRTAATPANVGTPMGVYREITGREGLGVHP